MKERIILVQPRVGDWDDFRSHPALPLALLSVSREIAGDFDISLVDTRIDKDWRQSLIKELDRGALCVGVTSMTGGQINHALEVSRVVKENSSIPVVWGGIHASMFPESTIQDDFIDAIVVGEGERTFQKLVCALAGGRDLSGIPGIWYKDGSRIVKNQLHDFLKLDSLPQLPLGLIKLNKYLPVFKGRRTFYLETSRGCPNSCSFCYNPSFNRSTWRAFSIARTLEDIGFLYRVHRVRSFYIVDDNFFVDLQRARSVAQGIIDQGMDIIWEAQGISINSALKMDEEYLSVLERSGLRKVHFGVESGSERILRLVNKRIRIEDVIKINQRWRKFNIIAQYNFMCGFPGERMKDLRMTVDLVFKLMKENPNALISPLCPYTPYPGTALYNNQMGKRFRKRATLREWSQTNYGDNLWQSKRRKKILSALFFASQFLDTHRSKDMVQSRLIKILISLYRPIAKFRVKHLFFGFMPELKVKEFFTK